MSYNIDERIQHHVDRLKTELEYSVEDFLGDVAIQYARLERDYLKLKEAYDELIKRIMDEKAETAVNNISGNVCANGVCGV